MPYKIIKANNLYMVVNKTTGKVKGKKKTRSEAERLMRALYANERVKK